MGRALLTLFVVVFTGCTHTVRSGTPIDARRLAALEVGTTRCAEIQAAWGPPQYRSQSSTGTSMISYSHIVATGTAFSGGHSAMTIVLLQCDEHGVLTKVDRHDSAANTTTSIN